MREMHTCIAPRTTFSATLSMPTSPFPGCPPRIHRIAVDTDSAGGGSATLADAHPVDGGDQEPSVAHDSPASTLNCSRAAYSEMHTATYANAYRHALRIQQRIRLNSGMHIVMRTRLQQERVRVRCLGAQAPRVVAAVERGPRRRKQVVERHAGAVRRVQRAQRGGVRGVPARRGRRAGGGGRDGRVQPQHGVAGRGADRAPLRCRGLPPPVPRGRPH